MIKEDNKPFKLFSNCLLVKGTNRSVICDLQENDFKFIPNDLYEILKIFKANTIAEIKENYQNKFNEIIDEYFQFLIENNFIFFTNEIESFPVLSLNWDEPSVITNSIVDIDEFSEYDYKTVITQLEKVDCRALQFRFFKNLIIEDIESIINYVDKINSVVNCVEFIIPFSSLIEEKLLIHLLILHPRIQKIIVYSSTIEKIVNPVRENKGYLIYLENSIINEKSCGLINSLYFSINVKSFTESQHHNTCLNRKISIDKDGNIKNCPSMPESYGNIKNTTLEQALNHPNFKKYWNINKDQIEVCKDCEFRHICTDCRAYIEDPNNMYSKPLKCGYNPYTNEWSEWSTNPLKQKAIEFYNMQELVKKDA